MTNDDGSIQLYKTVNNWLKLYVCPTVTAVGRRVDIPNVCPYTGDDGVNYSFTDRSRWYACEPVYPVSGINPEAKKYLESIGKNVTVNFGSYGERTNENGRYWIAVGPNVVNPNHGINETPDPENMYGKGLLDIVLKDKSGELWYLPAVVGDIKNHTHYNGIIHTWKAYPDGAYDSARNYDLPGYEWNQTVAVEFIGNVLGKMGGFNNYSIDHIIFYDEEDNV